MKQRDGRTPARFFRSAIAGGSAATALMCFAASASAQGAPQDKGPHDWWLQVTPYIWLANIHGGVTTGDYTVPIDAAFGDAFSTLKIAFSAHAEFGKGRLLGAIDFATLKVGEDSIPIAAPELGTSGDYVFTALQTEVFGAYRLGGFGRPTRLDLLAGIRYTYQDQDLVIRATPIDKYRGFSEAWIDFIAGARFGADLGRRWYVSALANAGTGGASFTAEAQADIGFRILRWLDVDLGFRYLFVDYEDGVPGSPAFYSYNADQYALMLGFGARF